MAFGPAMATTEDGLSNVSVVSVVENVLQQHGNRFSDVGSASKKADEACMIVIFFFILMIFFWLYFVSFHFKFSINF